MRQHVRSCSFPSNGGSNLEEQQAAWSFQNNCEICLQDHSRTPLKETKQPWTAVVAGSFNHNHVRILKKQVKVSSSRWNNWKDMFMFCRPFALDRRGAVEARMAHNPEVVRSKRTAGIRQLFFSPIWKKRSVITHDFITDSFLKMSLICITYVHSHLHCMMRENGGVRASNPRCTNGKACIKFTQSQGCQLKKNESLNGCKNELHQDAWWMWHRIFMCTRKDWRMACRAERGPSPKTSWVTGDRHTWGSMLMGKSNASKISKAPTFDAWCVSVKKVVPMRTATGSGDVTSA